MITYNWIISSMDSKLKDGDLTDVVITVHWRRSAQTDDYNPEAQTGYYADVYGAYSTTVDPENFIPYNDLTKDNVIGWLEAGLVDPTPSEIDAQLAANIELQKNPVEESLPLPWSE
jgi:methionine aminopeptidase